MIRLLLATTNPGKVREIREMTADRADLVWVGLDSFPNVPDALETGQTFAENARLKALHYAAATGLHSLADDSGLVVDALGGAPGVYSARYAGFPRSDAANNRKLVQALSGITLQGRSARFECAMAFVSPTAVLFESAGCFEGLIIDEPRGTNGFGYDPHFLVPSLGRTAAELSPEEKHAVSHRGRALREMLPRIFRWIEARRPEPARHA